MGDSGYGAYHGYVAVMSLILGRTKDNMKDPDGIRYRTYALARKLHDRFIQEYGCIMCRDLQAKFVGRYFHHRAHQKFVKYIQLGDREIVGPRVVGNATKWTVEILAEEGLLPR